MLKFIESTGKTKEEAIAAALAKLGMDRDDVSVEVLECGKTGFLGIGSVPAKVKVTYEAPDEPAPAPVPAPAPAEPVAKPAAPAPAAPQPVEKKAPEAPAAPAQPAAAPAPAPAPAPAAAAVETGSREERVVNFLTGLLGHMGSDAVPHVVESNEENIKVELVGEHLGALIGRRGETLDAIQQLTNYSINRGQAKRLRIHIDAEGYRAKREESLQRLANKVAGKVVKYRKNVMLEPMNAYERHVIHTALQDYRDITTYSTGTEPNRRIVVAYSKGQNT
jgi:spoIIIJ-associated protein